MKAAVTGGNGLVGKYVAKELMNHGWEVCILDSKLDDSSDLEQHQVDIRDSHAVYQALKGCDAVVHLAAIGAPRYVPDEELLKINVIGSYNVVDAAGKHGIKKVVIASSDSAYGFAWSLNKPKPDYLPVDEAHRDMPDDEYGMSKVMIEKMADTMVLRYPFMTIATLRITHIISEAVYQDDEMMADLFGQPDKGPTNLWAYVDARDAAEAFRLGIEREFAGHEVFLITAKDTRSTMNSREIAEAYYPGVPMKEDWDAYQSFENCDKAASVLGFEPKYSWRDQ